MIPVPDATASASLSRRHSHSNLEHDGPTEQMDSSKAANTYDIIVQSAHLPFVLWYSVAEADLVQRHASVVHEPPKHAPGYRRVNLWVVPGAASNLTNAISGC
jgi:hypothetical protein